MKIFSFLIFFNIVSTMAFAQVDTLAYRVQAAAIQKKYAPDRRSVYFNLQIKGDSVKLESSSEEALRQFDLLKPAVTGINFSSVLLPSKALNGLEYAVVNISVGNNRANPQHLAELMTQTLLGMPIHVLKKQGGYYLVKTPDGYLSWTDGGSIKLMDKDQFNKWRGAEKMIFTADYGHCFSTPNVESQRVSDLVSGNILQLLGEQRNFYKLSYPDGRVGYVPKSQMMPYQKWIARPNPTANQILSAAQMLIGVPYLWGGTSIKGVDCSGFTKTAYFLNGVIIPRDASQQALVGVPVEVLQNDTISVDQCLKNLKPGDLLFFSAAKRRGINGGRISHTAIYMGDGQFIQSAGMVKISSLVPTSPLYDSQSGTLVSARRFLTEIGTPEISRVAAHNWYTQNE